MHCIYIYIYTRYIPELEVVLCAPMHVARVRCINVYCTTPFKRLLTLACPMTWMKTTTTNPKEV